VDQRNGITGVAFQNGKSSMLKINILQILKKMSMPRKQKETSNILKNLRKQDNILFHQAFIFFLMTTDLLNSNFLQI
jgi:hypothetical protein